MMQRLLNRQRLVALGFVAANLAGAVLSAPAHAQQTPASSAQSAFRVIVMDLVNKADPKNNRAGVKTSEAIRKGFSQMARHTAVPAKDVDAELKKLNVLKTAFDCTTARQLAARNEFAQVTMCGEYEPEGAGLKVSASFFTKDEQISYDVMPFTAANEADAAAKIVEEFNRYVQQLTMVTVCQNYAQSQQYTEAVDRCTQALQLNPRSVPSLFYKALALVGLDRKEEGLAAYKALLELAPTNTDAMMNAGILAAQLGQSDLSQRYFRDFLALDPDNQEIRATIASNLNKAGDPLGAAALLEEGLKGDTTKYAVMRAIGDYTLVAALKVAKASGPAADDAAKAEANALFNKALASYTRVINNLKASNLTTGQQNDLYNYAMTAYLQIGQPDKAIALGALATALDSVKAPTFITYATALGTSGRQADAIAALDRAGALDPTLKMSYQKAILSLASGNLEDIVRFARQAATEGTPDAQIDGIAQQLVATGSKHGSEKQEWWSAGKSLAKSEKTIAMANFYQGADLYTRAAAMIPKAGQISKPNARAALSQLTSARALVQGAGAFTEAASSRAEILSNIDKTVTYLNQVLKQQ